MAHQEKRKMASQGIDGQKIAGTNKEMVEA
jgi:hypothetical protein